MWRSPKRHNGQSAYASHTMEVLSIMSSIYCCLPLEWTSIWALIFRKVDPDSGVTKGERGGRVAHPWKVQVEFLEGRGKGKKGREGKEEREKRGKEKMENGKEKNWNFKRGGWKPNNGRGKVWTWAEDLFLLFFFLSLFETTEICLGCTKMEIYMGKKSGNGKFSNLAHLWLHTWLRPWIQTSHDSFLADSMRPTGLTKWTV